MANGIDRRYTGIPIIPQVVEEKTSMWDAIVPLAQMAKEEKARQDALNLKWTEIRQKNEEASDLKQYRSDELSQRRTYQQGQLNIAKERNQIAKMEFEKNKADKSERETVAAIQQISNDYKEQVKQYRALAESTGKNSYNMLADNLESNGIAKEGIEPIKQNLMQENNPFKIREYLRLNGEELDKYYPRASALLDRKATDLEKEYNVTTKEVTDSQIYQTAVEQINEKQKNPAGGFNEDYDMETYAREINQAKMLTIEAIQSPAVPIGVAPVSEEDISMIWDNPEARDEWLTNPLDDINEIKKKYGMITEPADPVDPKDPKDPTEKDVQAVGYRDVYDKIKALDDNSIITIKTPDGKTQEIRAKEYQSLPGLVSDKRQREGMKIVAIQGGTAFTENQMKRSAMKFMGDDTPVYKIGTNQPVMVEGMKGNKLIVGGEEYTFEEYSEKFTNVPYTKY